MVDVNEQARLANELDTRFLLNVVNAVEKHLQSVRVDQLVRHHSLREGHDIVQAHRQAVIQMIASDMSMTVTTSSIGTTALLSPC